ncbi:MAG: bifunctional serine/threonine-protein kinase/formylglycine-generating enzyme family protein [Deltaproteobacteria bacterium]
MTESCSTTLKMGDVLNDKWVILEFLDKGGMGEVYRAHQNNLNRDVAIKVISREWLESIEKDDEDAETSVQRFRREVQAMAQVCHPNVLQVYDYDSVTLKICEKDATIEYIAMEYVPGGSLRATMPEDGFFPDEVAVRNWLRDCFMLVLEGVLALHRIGIVHRDLKPENILMDHQTPKIADFGLARSHRLKSVTQSIDVKGTPQYMSPEHFSDFKRADQRADVFSLGKILYEAVEGKIKRGTIPFKSARLKQTSDPFFQQLDMIIQKATAEDRNERLASVQELLARIDLVVHAVAALERVDVSTEPKPASMFSRSKWIRTGVAVTAVSVLLMILWQFMDKFDISISRENSPAVVYNNNKEAGPAIQSHDRRSLSNAMIQDTIEHVGRQQHIPGGRMVLPSGFGASSGELVEVTGFDMDVFLVTNLQYVDFLNHNRARIIIENGVVKGDGAIWYLLGAVYDGYEPIVYRDNEFHVSDAAMASNPVLRATGYGASAFANFFGRRLPTQTEWLYVLIEGANRLQSNGKDIPTSSVRDLNEQMPAAFYTPNAFGIRGMNEGLAEWALRVLTDPSKDMTHENRYAVIGGMEGEPRDGGPIPAVLDRFPFESCEDTGFRTVVGLAEKK